MPLRPHLDRLDRLASLVQSPLLLVIRLYWGWSLFLTGRGKLRHLDRTAAFFGGLGIPWPKLNVALVGSLECGCGLLLFAGLFSRVAALPLIVTLSVAYLTADRAALHSIFSDPDRFTSATPFLFLLAVVIVFAFGPGRFSLDQMRLRRRAG